MNASQSVHKGLSSAAIFLAVRIRDGQAALDTSRDLLGFVDGTENPSDQDANDATLIGDNGKPGCAHNALTVITEDGEAVDITRSNMPFGDIGEP